MTDTYKTIGKIFVQLTPDNDEYSEKGVGEVSGAFVDEHLKNHILKHGTVGLFDSLARMTGQILDMEHKINNENTKF